MRTAILSSARLTPIRVALLLILLGTLGFFAVRPLLTHQAAGAGGAAGLAELQDIQQLQERFNRDGGNPRLVLLLSPT